MVFKPLKQKQNIFIFVLLCTFAHASCNASFQKINPIGQFHFQALIAVSLLKGFQLSSTLNINKNHTLNSSGKMTLSPTRSNMGRPKHISGRWEKLSNKKIRTVIYQKIQGGKICKFAGLKSCVIRIAADIIFNNNNNFTVDTKPTITVFDQNMRGEGKRLPVKVKIFGQRRH